MDLVKIPSICRVVEMCGINLYMFQALVINRVGIDLDGVGVVNM
jgi:hypothetical protein